MIKSDRNIKDKRPHYDEKHDKVILHYDNARPHVAKTVQKTLQVLNWEILSHPPYLPSFVPPDYHLFRSIHSAPLGERFSSCEEVTKWVDQWIASNEPDFYIAESICC